MTFPSKWSHSHPPIHSFSPTLGIIKGFEFSIILHAEVFIAAVKVLTYEYTELFWSGLGDSGCRREENYQSSLSQFWARDPDHSCQQFMAQHGAEYSSEEASCGILSQYISFISTPLFIAVSQVDSLISGGYGCPQARYIQHSHCSIALQR